MTMRAMGPSVGPNNDDFVPAYREFEDKSLTNKFLKLFGPNAPDTVFPTNSVETNQSIMKKKKGVCSSAHLASLSVCVFVSVGPTTWVQDPVYFSRAQVVIYFIISIGPGAQVVLYLIISIGPGAQVVIYFIISIGPKAQVACNVLNYIYWDRGPSSNLLYYIYRARGLSCNVLNVCVGMCVCVIACVCVCVWVCVSVLMRVLV